MNQKPGEGGDGVPPEITLGQLWRALWRALKEMQTVLYLLVIIAVVSFAGAVIPQKESPEAYTERYGQAVSHLLTGLGLDQVYSTTWYLLLLALLLLSLAACSGRLWSQARERWRVPQPEAAARRSRSWSGSAEARLASPPEEAAQALTRQARRRGFRTWALGDVEGVQWLYLCRHRRSAWGLPMTHYAVFLVAIGALLGVLPGLSVDSWIEITEGQTYYEAAGPVPFSVQLHSFRIVIDPKTGAIENYYSDVSILDEGKEVVRQTISVNHPLVYRHYFLSQSSWGLSSARVEAIYKGEKSEMVFPLQHGMPEMGGGAAWVVPSDHAAAFTADETLAVVAGGFHADAKRQGDEVVARPTEGLGNPALELVAVSGFAPDGRHKMEELGWLFPGEKAQMESGSVKFLGVSESSTLGVRKDYGANLVWVGFAMSVLGMMMVFYFPIRQAVVSLKPAGRAQTAVTASFRQRGNQPGETPEEFWSRLLNEAGSQEPQAGRTEPQEDPLDE